VINIKIIQSFWSKPSLLHTGKNENEDILERKFGGWLEKKYCYMSWALSCLTLKRHYKNVELVSDTLGNDILIDKIGLPYTNTITALDKLNSQDVELWATAKLHAYLLQKEPFIHVDSDIFIWKPLPKHLTSASLIVQNLETSFKEYFAIWDQVCRNFKYIPEYMINDYEQFKTIKSCNAGVFGGSDIEFLHEFANEALSFLLKNEIDFYKINLGYSVLIYEQYLFSCLARMKNKEPTYLFKGMKSGYEEITDFSNVPLKSPYIHMVGGTKGRRTACKNMEERLLLEYPYYYYKIIRLIERQEI